MLKFSLEVIAEDRTAIVRHLLTIADVLHNTLENEKGVIFGADDRIGQWSLTEINHNENNV